MDEAVRKLKQAILSLEIMDDILISLCREALQFASASPGQAGGSFTTSEADLRLLEASRECYRRADFSPQEMVEYLASFRDLKRYWLSVARTVVDWRSKATLQRMEWLFRTKQLQDAGDESWRIAVQASNAVCRYGTAEHVNTLTAKFRLVDDVLNPLYDSIPELGARSSFGDEYNDTLLAVINIMQAKGPDCVLEKTQVEMYKSELRLRRNVSKLNAIDTSAQQPIGSSTPGQVPADASSSIQSINSDTEKQVKSNPTTLGVTLILTFTSAILTVKAWQYSAPSPGTTQDADFWFLLQSCLMQLAGLFPVALELWTSSSGPVQPRLWSWIFAAGSLSCTILAPILYCFVPTAVSGVVSFAGRVLQVFILLEALLVAKGTAEPKAHKS